MRKKLTTRIKNAIVFCLFAISAVGCAAHKETMAPPLPSTEDPGAAQPTQESMTFVGNVTAAQSSTLAWRAGGVIESVNVKLGDTVKKGDVLATLARDSLSSSVIQAEIPWIEAQDQLAEVMKSEVSKATAYKDLRDKEYAVGKAEDHQESLKYPHGLQRDIDSAKQQLDWAEQYYREAQEAYTAVALRDDIDPEKKKLSAAVQEKLNKYGEAYNNYLYYRNNASQNEIDQAAADIKKAQAEYAAALKVFRTYAQTPREKDVKAAELKISQAKDAYDMRAITADINGTISVVKARAGDYVEIGSSAFKLENMDRLYLPLNVSEIDIIKLSNGMKAAIVLDANPSKVYDGVLRIVSEKGTEENDRVTFAVSVEFLEPDEKVKVGMTGEINIILNSSRL